MALGTAAFSQMVSQGRAAGVAGWGWGCRVGQGASWSGRGAGGSDEWHGGLACLSRCQTEALGAPGLRPAPCVCLHSGKGRGGCGAQTPSPSSGTLGSCASGSWTVGLRVALCPGAPRQRVVSVSCAHSIGFRDAQLMRVCAKRQPKDFLSGTF